MPTSLAAADRCARPSGGTCATRVPGGTVIVSGAVGLRPRWRLVEQVQRGQRREQERDREHDAEVEQVDQAVERVAGAVLVRGAAAWVGDLG